MQEIMIFKEKIFNHYNYFNSFFSTPSNKIFLTYSSIFIFTNDLFALSFIYIILQVNVNFAQLRKRTKNRQNVAGADAENSADTTDADAD